MERLTERLRTLGLPALAPTYDALLTVVARYSQASFLRPTLVFASNEAGHHHDSYDWNSYDWGSNGIRGRSLLDVPSPGPGAHGLTSSFTFLFEKLRPHDVEGVFISSVTVERWCPE